MLYVHLGNDIYHPCATLLKKSELGIHARVGENDSCCDSSCSCDTICNSSHIKKNHFHKYFGYWLSAYVYSVYHMKTKRLLRMLHDVIACVIKAKIMCNEFRQ